MGMVGQQGWWRGVHAHSLIHTHHVRGLLHLRQETWEICEACIYTHVPLLTLVFLFLTFFLPCSLSHTAHTHAHTWTPCMCSARELFSENIPDGGKTLPPVCCRKTKNMGRNTSSLLYCMFCDCTVCSEIETLCIVRGYNEP